LSVDQKFLVRTNKPIAGVTYQIIARGKILDWKYVDAKNSKRFEFAIKPTMEMIPNANVLVYYIDASGEIVSDSLTFEFGDELKNFVSFKNG
jgi:Alpha-2-macroglobulin bait region domain